MKIQLILHGKTKFNFVSEGMDLYQRRLKQFCDFELKVIDDIKTAKNLSVKQYKEKEAEKLIKLINRDDYLVLLDEKGDSYNSLKFASYIEKLIINKSKKIVFVVGGAYGFSDEIYKRADFLLSLSAMTFSHQIIRLFFMEQIYRAFTIIKGLPYHNE